MFSKGLQLKAFFFAGSGECFFGGIGYNNGIGVKDGRKEKRKWVYFRSL
jgi:hypothetical protein